MGEMERKCIIVGGPRDGQEVPYVGPSMQEPIPPRMPRIEEPIEPSVGFKTRTYDLYKWMGDDGIEWRYVLREAAEGLGAKSP